MWGVDVVVEEIGISLRVEQAKSIVSVTMVE